ncbi:APC family permease [Fodinibius sediminis]|uniref:Amino acid/polyamine/organocation transporter, APC superfamily n=1 Tax=Fodinibius sediminis TaxID=1214077 RepID=A0A521ELU4_9BACT|nr:APC family permease [Fodinibius sediminis]SMO84874.1 amino acid/polyamine/organocation transporter, APC superfamily [Fodinibius sediminis]
MIQEYTSSTAEQEEKLPRKLGLWGIWLLVINGFIGAGIFGLPSGAARLAGEYSVWIYLICAVLMLPVILCFAELGSYFRGTGGPVRYGTEAFGSFIGFQGGWLYYVARMISFSANSVLLVDSIGYFYAPAGEGIGRLVSLALICGGLTLVNIIGSVESIRSLAVFTVFKFSVLIFLVFGGLALLGSEVYPSFASPVPPIDDLGEAALLLIYAFVGFEGAVVPAGEAKRPERDMPAALLLGLGSVVVLYMFIQLVAQAAVPSLGSSSAPLLDASEALFGNTGAIILMIGVVTSVTGNLFSTMFSTPRLTYALSIQGSLPAWFGNVHSRFLTPHNSILFFGFFAFIGAAVGSFTALAAMTVLSRLLLFIISCAAVPVLRKKLTVKKSFILKGGYLIPGLGILACIWLMFQVTFTSIWLTTLFIVIGTGLYLMGNRQDPSKE